MAAQFLSPIEGDNYLWMQGMRVAPGAGTRTKVTRMRRWHSQDPGRRTSGQVAVAVITGRPVEEITERIGHTHHASTRELSRVLGHYGYLCAQRCIPAKELKELPKLGLAQVHSYQSSRWHWVAVEGERIFDGIWGDAYGIVDWPNDFRITSYLPIEE